MTSKITSGDSSTLLPSRDLFTVSRLNMEVRSALENSFPLLWVSGEISNLSQPRSGHVYFSLKDQDAQVRCALFRSRRTRLRFSPTNGMQVIVRARITLFEPRGDFQLVIEHIEPGGEGPLRQQIDALKTKLDSEGLFDATRKRPIPEFPRRIGVITSASGAAIRDVLTVLKRRFPAIEVVIYAASVQGERAAGEICAMIEAAGIRNECDLLILTRGGGALEDLMAFNDESVVRAVAACPLPLVSAVGHEVDVTLTDLAADRRAPTPSAAAELVSPDATEVAAKVSGLAARIERQLGLRIKRLKGGSQSLVQRLVRLHPSRRLNQQQQLCDELERRMRRHIQRTLTGLSERQSNLAGRLTLQSPARRLDLGRERLAHIEKQLLNHLSRRLARLNDKTRSLFRQLHAVSPLATLGRGYAILRREDSDEIIRKTSQVTADDRLEARLDDGSLLCRVEAVKSTDPD